MFHDFLPLAKIYNLLEVLSYNLQFYIIYGRHHIFQFLFNLIVHVFYDSHIVYFLNFNFDNFL